MATTDDCCDVVSLNCVMLGSFEDWRAQVAITSTAANRRILENMEIRADVVRDELARRGFYETDHEDEDVRVSIEDASVLLFVDAFGLVPHPFRLSPDRARAIGNALFVAANRVMKAR